MSLDHEKQITLSKYLTWILRHGALTEGFVFSKEGYIKICDLLNHRSIKGIYSLEDILFVVKNNNKQRFKIQKNPIDGALEVKANQGHSIKSIGNAGLKRITEHTGYTNVIHGTYYKNWDSIRVHGLSRMNRIHIHLTQALPKDGKVISGARSNSEVFIYIDLGKALTEGIIFFLSENGVILTPGNKKGILEAKYFKKVVSVKGEELRI